MVPAHLQTAREITGTLEAPGSDDNPVILGWAREIGQRFPDMASYISVYTHDEIPWCGLTVAYCLAHNGIRPQFGGSDTGKFLWARSWANFGTERQGEPQPGDILVFDGHVSFYEGTEGGYYLCRGGNQSDAVTVAHYPASSVRDIRVVPSTAVGGQPAPIATSKQKRFTGITATVFGGESDDEESAYDGHAIGEDELGVALPFRFTGSRPRVRVWNGSRSVDCAIVDVGPWNINDPYWQTGRRPQAESGTDHSGRSTNRAGIDLTPAAAEALGIEGKGTVDWAFIDPAAEEAVLRPQSRKLVLTGWGQRAAESLAAAIVGWVGTINWSDPQTVINLGFAAAFLVVLAGMWLLLRKLDRLMVQDYRDGRWKPSRAPTSPPKQKALPAPPQRSTTMNPALAAIISQIVGALVSGATSQTTFQPAPAPAQFPGPVGQPAPASNGPAHDFFTNLLTAVFMAAAHEVVKGLPLLLQQTQQPPQS